MVENPWLTKLGIDESLPERTLLAIGGKNGTILK